MSLETVLAECQAPEQRGIFLVTGLLREAGTPAAINLAESLETRAITRVVEETLELVPAATPAVSETARRDLGKLAVEIAEDTAIPVSDFPARPRTVPRPASIADPSHPQSKRARVTQNDAPV